MRARGKCAGGLGRASLCCVVASEASGEIVWNTWLAIWVALVLLQEAQQAEATPIAHQISMKVEKGSVDKRRAQSARHQGAKIAHKPRQ